MNTYGIIRNGKAIEGVSISSFVDWEDHAVRAVAEKKTERKVDVGNINRARFNQRLAEDGATEIRLFPVEG